MIKLGVKVSDVSSEPLVLPQGVIGLFEAALEKPDWIEDKVADQFPRTWGKNSSGIPLSGAGGGANHGNPNQGKKRGISKSLGGRPRAVASEANEGSSAFRS